MDLRGGTLVNWVCGLMILLVLLSSGSSSQAATLAFSKVGDSISFSWAYLFDFGYDYNLANYGYLQPAVDSFGPSFLVNPPIAAYPGWTSGDVLLEGKIASCGELSPLVCAYYIEDPDIALILLGTNDVAQGTSIDVYQYNMQEIVDITLEMDIIPVVITIPPFTDRDNLVEAYNTILRDIAASSNVYLIDYWSFSPDMSLDGVHPSAPPDRKSAYFDSDHLQYGFNVLNLNILKMLYQLMRQIP